MAASEAQRRATAKWQKEKAEEMKFHVPKGKKTVIQEHTRWCGEFVNAFLLRAVDEAMKRDCQGEQSAKHLDLNKN